jgi:hypothetical protein
MLLQNGVAMLMLVVLALTLFFLYTQSCEKFESAGSAQGDAGADMGSLGNWQERSANQSTGAVGSTREQYLSDMVKYLLIVINMMNARQELYKLQNGYAQTFSSPRLDALEKQRQFFIEKVKKDPAQLAFFRENLVVIV